MFYNVTDKDKERYNKMEKIISEIIKILTYSENMDSDITDNSDDISKTIDNIMMNYFWRTWLDENPNPICILNNSIFQFKINRGLIWQRKYMMDIAKE